MKKIFSIAAIVAALSGNPANAAIVVYTGTVPASGTDTHSIAVAVNSGLDPFTLTLDLLTPPLDSFTLSWSVTSYRTNAIYNTYFDLTTDVTATTPALPAGPYTSIVQFTYPTEGISVQYQLSIAAVPLPPAIYLFSAGLVGLVGVLKKRKA